MTTFFYGLGSVILVSLISLVGVFVFVSNGDKLKKITSLLVGVSAGTLLGDSFLHLLPEIEESSSLSAWLWILSGIILFFVMEKIVCWRHCHIPTSHDHPHPFGTMNLIGDALHNFIDGMVIAGSFLINPAIGVATSIAVIAHEIPQEISDFGVFLHAGYSKSKALFLNFVSALTAILGFLIAYSIGGQSENFTMAIIPFTAGGFIYIAMADLIPELHKDTRPFKSLGQLISILIGIGIMLALKLFAE